MAVDRYGQVGDTGKNRLQQPPTAQPQWSPDRRFWWDGVRWVPVPAPPSDMPPPPNVPPAGYAYPGYGATAPPFVWKPSPGLRPFLIVMLLLADVVTGFFALFGLAALAQYLGYLGGTDATPEAGEYILIAVFVALFAITLGATVGVLLRARWARWVALAAGAALSLTCLGMVLGIPILVAAARAPIKKEAPSS